MSVATKIWTQATERPTARFLTIAEKHYQYVELLRHVEAYINCFDAHNLKEGDRVLIAKTSDAEAIFVFIAALLDGLVPVMMSPATKAIRLKAVFEKTGPKLSFVDEAFHDVAGSTQVPQVSLKGGLFNKLGLGKVYKTRPPRLPKSTNQLAYILFTSGSTQTPKGVMITHGNLDANLRSISGVLSISNQSRVFNDLQLAHADGLIQGPVLAAFNGAHCLRFGGFQIERLENWLNYIKRQKATHCIAVPTIWAMIDQLAQFDDYFLADHFQSLVSVADKLPAELWERLELKFKRPLISQYGLTETVASALYAGQTNKLNTPKNLGVPIDCEAKIVDPNAHGEGELYLRGANIFKGYWKDDLQTREALDDDWLKTGDIARRNEDGSFSFCGRQKNVLMTGGRLIRPEEVEEAALRHPQIQEAILVGLEDKQFGDVSALAVVVSNNLTVRQIYSHLEAELEPALVPHAIHLVEKLPQNLAGKLSRAHVKEMIIGHTEKQPATADAGQDIDKQIIRLIAIQFRLDLENMSLTATADDIAAWDSFSSLNLIMALEQEFEVKLRASQVTRIKTLNDFIVETKRSMEA